MTLSRPLYAALLATLALACLPAVAQNFDKAEIKTEKLSPSTYVMYGAGGNLCVSVGDAIVHFRNSNVIHMLATVNGRVKALMKDGKTREEIVAAKPSAEFDEKWGKAFINPGRFIEMLVVAQTPAPATNPTAK